MTTFQSLTEEARPRLLERIANAREADWTGGFEPVFLADFLDSFAAKTWNAAIDEAIGALPEYILIPGRDDYEHERLIGRNKVLDESRARLEALKMKI